MEKFPEVKRWFEQFKTVEGFETFSQGAQGVAKIINQNLKSGF